MERWRAARLLDIISFVSVPYSEQISRNQYRQSLYDSVMQILDTVYPFAAATSMTTNKRAATDEDRVKYMQLLGDKPYKSMQELLSAVFSLNKKIEEANK